MPFSMTNYDDDIGGSWGTPQHANGVLMQDGNITAGYNALNQPMQATSNALSPNWMFFGYDPLGRCVRRWTGQLVNGNPPLPDTSTAGTYFYYDGWNLIEEAAAGSASRYYVHGARVDEVVKQMIQYNPAPRFFHYDARGHCTLQTDASGNIAEQYEYDAFGYPYFFDASGNQIGYWPWGNRFLFTGREWLADLKLYDYRNRLYQPELGRFMQPDPKEFGAGDYNLYRYCHNDPINKTDPTGLDLILLNDSQAADKNGHNSVVVGNDKDGWMYFSKDGGPANVSKPFGSFGEFQRAEESKRFDRALRVETSKDQDKAMQALGKETYDRDYAISGNNCTDLTAQVGQKGGVAIESPKKGGLIYRNATHPNKQFDRLREHYGDKAKDVKPHIEDKKK